MTLSPQALRPLGLVAMCLACTAPAFAAQTPSSPGRIARCSFLYSLWWNYEQDPVFSHSGERAQAELALYRCQQGDYRPNIAALEDLLRHGRFSAPEQLGRNLMQSDEVGQRQEAASPSVK